MRNITVSIAKHTSGPKVMSIVSHSARSNLNQLIPNIQHIIDIYGYEGIAVQSEISAVLRQYYKSKDFVKVTIDLMRPTDPIVETGAC